MSARASVSSPAASPGDSSSVAPPSPPSLRSSHSLAESLRALRDSSAPLSPRAAPPTTTTTPPVGDARPSGQRKPAPTPLHQHAAYHAALPSAGSPRSSSFAFPSLPSPRERLDAFLATEDEVLSGSPCEPQSGLNSHPAAAPFALPTNAKSRNFSTTSITTSGFSPPSSPSSSAMAGAAKPSQPQAQARAMPGRNASIDSAISTVSSNASQPIRSGTSLSIKAADPPGGGATTLEAYIATAGGLEAAVQRLWKDKQQNDQLWRLIEKQRGMLMAASTNMDRLAKDLARVQKSKDRYKRKYEEIAGSGAADLELEPKHSVNGNREVSNSSAVTDRHDSRSAPKERVVAEQEPLTRETTKTPPTTTSSPVKPSDSASQTASVGDDASPVEPRSAIDIQRAEASAQAAKPSTDSTVSRQDSALKEQLGPMKSPAMAPQPLAIRRHAKTPSLTLTQASPTHANLNIPSPDQGHNRNANRKAPPAALDLSATQATHMKPMIAAAQAGSENDDGKAQNDLDRGRRKTREDDDKFRETLAVREAETRSKSNKKSKSKSKSATAKEQEGDSKTTQVPATIAVPPPTFIAGLPASPRMAPAAAGSINALLSPANSEGSNGTQRSLMSSPLSPGLPMSPRPGDRPQGAPAPRLPKSPMASPPMSPRNAMPLSPRAPRAPIPLPPQSMLSLASPHLARAEAYQQQMADKTTDEPNSKEDGKGPDKTTKGPELWSEANVYQGFVSEQYPGLLITPNALPVIHVRVFSSRLRPSRHSMLMTHPVEEDPVFQLGIYSRSENRQLWRVEKSTINLPALHNQVRSFVSFEGRLPEKQLFAGHAPAKIDARRQALNVYFETLLDTPLNEPAAHVVCRFFSADVIGASNDDPFPISTTPKVPALKPRKEGFLTKRGQKFGGWKARYFVLDGPDLRYYENMGGAHMGTIKLAHAQIGRQSNHKHSPSPSRRNPDDADTEFRHAFLILEPKSKDPSNKLRHILCAESDAERDAWVDALMAYVEPEAEQQPVSAEAAKEPGSARSFVFPGGVSDGGLRTGKPKAPPSQLQGVSYEDTIAAEAPVRGPPAKSDPLPALPSPTHNTTYGIENLLPQLPMPPQQNTLHPSISKPSGGTVIADAALWGNKAVSSIKDKKRSIFGFRGRSSSDLAPGQQNGRGPSPQPSLAPSKPEMRAVFGIPLAEAVECSQPAGVRYPIPSVAYRCVEYLKARGAKNEEGIFRLSGSQNVIKVLKERFNVEGDIDLLKGPYYDIHAVASLLKAYLRELPSSILTRELHLDFLSVIDQKVTQEEKTAMLNILAHRLPPANYYLLNTLIGYLTEVTDNADFNKMNIRNLSIVFAPTLNIQGPLIIAFLSDYAGIFGSPVDEAASPIREVLVSAPLTPEAIRSPRQQMFQDLPSPGYSQTGFNQAGTFYQQSQSSRPSGNETGFVPLKPAYEAPTPPTSFSQFQQQAQNADGYGSLNGALAPSNSREAKARRRESGMLLMTMGMNNGQRRPSLQNLKENEIMVREGTAFD